MPRASEAPRSRFARKEPKKRGGKGRWHVLQWTGPAGEIRLAPGLRPVIIVGLQRDRPVSGIRHHRRQDRDPAGQCQVKGVVVGKMPAHGDAGRIKGSLRLGTDLGRSGKGGDVRFGLDLDIPGADRPEILPDGMGWERPPPCHSKVRKRSFSAMSGTSTGPRAASSWVSVTSAGWAKMNVLRQRRAGPRSYWHLRRICNIDRQALPVRSRGGRASGLHLAPCLAGGDRLP